MFRKRTHMLATWNSNEKMTENQVHYIMISRRWRVSITDAFTVPRKKLRLLSDHLPVIAKLQLKLKKFKPKAKLPRLDMSTLRNPVTSAKYKNEFSKQLVSSEASENVEDTWKKIGHALKSAAEKTIPREKTRKKPWISPASLELIDRRA